MPKVAGRHPSRSRASSTCRPTASRAACRRTCRSTGPRPRASACSIQDIDDALNDAFAQRQISTIYTQRNQYRVVLEVTPRLQREPGDLGRIYVAGRGRRRRCRSRASRGSSAASRRCVVNHQGQFPSVTISFNLAPGVTAADGDRGASSRPSPSMHLPDTLHAEFAGDAQAFARTAGSQRLLILAALLAVYLVLGVLYESLVASADHHLDPALGGARARCWRCKLPGWS